MGTPLAPPGLAGRPRSAAPRTRLASAMALLCAAGVALSLPLGFVVGPGRAQAADGAGPWVSAWAEERLELPRGQAVPPTLLRGKYAEGGRSRKNNQGGGRLPIRVTRNPVLAYSSGGVNEAGGSVLRRMWDMYDMDFNKMVAIRQRYFRPDYRKKQWTADYNMRMGRRKKQRRIKAQYETDWQEWMRREGRKQGLTEPLVYNGPPLKMTKEMDEMSEPANFQKWLGSEDDIKEKKRNMPKHKDRMPEEMKPGCWNDDAPENIFKIWRRPLCKWPYDIGKRGKKGPVVRGIVM